MCRLLIFGGTTEGRQLAQFCAEHRISAWVSVASQYGSEMLPVSEYLHTAVKPMDQQEMELFIRERGIRLVIDATHPYAKEATKNIKKACAQEKIPLVRCLRDDDAEDNQAEDGVIYVPAAKDAVQALEQTEGNIFVTTGSKELSAFTALSDYENRVYARVLPSPEAVEQCRKLGISGRRLICMQGPFSEELNTAMMRQIDARWMVTKETGKNGGYSEKLRAARAAGASVIVIRREREHDGCSIEAVKEKILDFAGRDGNGKTEETVRKEKTEEGREGFQAALAGIGPGGWEETTLGVVRRILRSRVLLGAPRMLESALDIWDRFAEYGQLGGGETLKRPLTKAIYMPGEIAGFLEEYQGGGQVTILFSGDTGFYSGAKKLAKELNKRAIPFQILPGISSAAYFSARLGISWERGEFLTAHGRRLDVEDIAERFGRGGNGENRWLFILLAGTEGAGEVCARLAEAGFGSRLAAVGERLSYEDEQIRRGTVGELAGIRTDGLSLLAVEAEPGDGGL